MLIFGTFWGGRCSTPLKSVYYYDKVKCTVKWHFFFIVHIFTACLMLCFLHLFQIESLHVITKLFGKDQCLKQPYSGHILQLRRTVL